MTLYAKIQKKFDTFSLNVEFEANNTVMGLLGASGCGKSMTLKCLAGIVRPDKGRIVSEGVTLFDSEKGIDLPPQKREMGLLFQNYALFPNMTVEENILSVLSINGTRERLRSRVDKFYIGRLENHYPAQLSGGQQQRVALARMMAGSPKVIMLDEPLSALDSYLRWQLEGELAQTLEEFDGTVLYVSHTRDEIYRLCKHVCVMNDGRSETVRPTAELFESPYTFASCLLSGCKNYSRIEKRDAHTLYAIDWGTTLVCHTPIADDTRYIGVRAHYLSLSSKSDAENAFRCRVLRVTQDVFSTILTLRPEGAPAAHDFSRIRMELAKHDAGGIHAQDSIFVRVAPGDMMLLRK